MTDKIKNKSIRDIEIERKQQNQNPPYYQGTIRTIDSSSNKLYPNQSRHNQIKSIRLYSANSSLSKVKKQNGSQDKIKMHKDSNILPSFYGSNYQTVQGRPTSVKPKHQNLIYQQKRKVGGIGISTELNAITLNTANSQVNYFPLQRKRKIIYEKDDELAGEYDKLRKIWKEAGVTDAYIDNFETVTNNKNNTKQEILQSLKMKNNK